MLHSESASTGWGYVYTGEVHLSLGDGMARVNLDYILRLRLREWCIY